MSFSPEDYKRIYGKEGGILSFELRGKGLNSETGYKSVAGITYSGKMTADRLQELMQRIAQRMQSQLRRSQRPSLRLKRWRWRLSKNC